MNTSTVGTPLRVFVLGRIKRFAYPFQSAALVIHLMGKLRRFYLIHLRKRYVQRQLEIRGGECHQCGTCCSLAFTCFMLTREGLCRTYSTSRWRVCKLFPIDERDLRDVALAGGTCGYYFGTEA